MNKVGRRAILAGSASALAFAADANARIKRGIIIVSGSPTITSITLSNTTFTGGSPSGTVVGAITVNMTGGSFSGSLSVGGTNASDFAISGSNLVTSGVVANGSYSITITATQTGVSNSPYTGGPYTITGSSGTAVTTFALNSTSSSTQSNIVVELALPLPPATLNSTQALSVSGLSGLSGVQADQTTTDYQSSIRFQKVAFLASLAGNSSNTITLTSSAGSSASGTPIATSDLLAATVGGDSYETILTFTDPSGATHTASARTGLAASTTFTYGSAFNKGTFRSGPYITEFVVDVPVTLTSMTYPMVVQFHITAAKVGTGPYNASTNPIVWTRTKVRIINGWITKTGQADQIYDLLIKTGVSSPTTVYQLNGSALSGITLGATSGGGQYQQNSVTVTRSSGSWAAKTFTHQGPGGSDNANDVGKAIVEGASGAGSPGRGWIADWQSSTVVALIVPTTTAFSTTSPTCRTMGMYHQNGSTRVVPNITQGTIPQYNAIITATYIRATQMVPNMACGPSTINNTSTAPDGTLAAIDSSTFDGSHPASLSILGSNGSTCRQFQLPEGATGETPAIGVMPYFVVVGFANYDSDYANSLQIIEQAAFVENIRTYWLMNEWTGGFLSDDIAGYYSEPIFQYVRGAGVAATYDNAGSTPWNYSFAHFGDNSYLAYIVTGELQYLQNVYMQHMSVIFMGGTDPMVTPTLVAPSSGGTTTLQLTTGTLVYGLGEAMLMTNTAGVTFNGTAMNTAGNLFFIRPLSSNTFEAYDTYLDCVNTGSTTGRYTIAGTGGQPQIYNGADMQQIDHAQTAGQPRAVAWCMRTTAEAAAVMPDSIGGNIIGPGTSQTICRRNYNQCVLYQMYPKTQDPNYVAGGPRWYDAHFDANPGGPVTAPPWMFNYLRQATNHITEIGLITGTTDPMWEYHVWSLADVFQWNLASNGVVPFLHDNAYYIAITDQNGNNYAYTYAKTQEYMIASEGNTAITIPGATCTITSVANQSSVAVSFNTSFFNMSNTAQYIPGWITLGQDQNGGGGLPQNYVCQITSVDSASSCHVSTTAASNTWNQYPPGPSLITMTNEPFYLGGLDAIYASLINGVLVFSNPYAYGNMDYLWLSRASMEIAYQAGVDTGNYATVTGLYNSAGFPSITYPLSTTIWSGGSAASVVKFGVQAR